MAAAPAGGAAMELGKTASSPAATTKPNIVLILTDDQRWDSLWAMPNTKQLLIDHGVQFTNGFVDNPLCCPSRASILTGEYSHTHGVYSNGVSGGFTIFHDQTTIATVLHAAGYRTALLGKYLNAYCDGDASYVRPGWDRWFAFTSDCGQGGYFDWNVSDQGTLASFGAAPADYSTDVLANHAVSFIEATPSSQPLFLYLSTKAPHGPFTPAPRDANAFPNLAPSRPPSYNEQDVSDKPAWVRALPLLTPAEQTHIDTQRKDWFRTLLAVDDAVARVVSTLKATGRLSNTLIVFTSDNGLLFGEHRVGNAKNNGYDEAIHVPYVVRYDPLTTTPRVDAHLVMNIDFAPTFAALAGATMPRADGRSVLPLLSETAPSWRQDFLVEHKQEGTPTPTFCEVRSGTFAYTQYTTGEEELYDLRNDRFELTSVAHAPAYAAELANMRTRVHALCSPPPPGMVLRH